MELRAIYEQFVLYGVQLGYTDINQLTTHFSSTFNLKSEKHAQTVLTDTIEYLTEQDALFIDTTKNSLTIISSELMDEMYVTAFQTIHNIEHLAYQLYVQKILALTIPRIKDSTIESLANTMGGSGTMNYQHFQFALAHLCQMEILIEKYGIYYFDKEVKAIFDTVVEGAEHG